MTDRTPSGLAERSYFFAHVMPQIQDMEELRVVLTVFYLLHQKQGLPRFVTYGELLSNSGLVAQMGEGGLRRALDSAV